MRKLLVAFLIAGLAALAFPSHAAQLEVLIYKDDFTRIIVGKAVCSNDSLRADIALELRENPAAYREALVEWKGKAYKACAYVTPSVVCVIAEDLGHGDMPREAFVAAKET